MVNLRPTRHLLRIIPESEKVQVPSDTALGDWYVKRLVVARRPLLLLVSSRGLLPMLIPARDVRGLPLRLAELVGARLKRLGAASRLIAAETGAMTPVVVARATDRSTLGIMVDFGKSVPYHFRPDAWDDTTLPFVERRLAETPCHAGRRSEDVVYPDKVARELLAARWNAG